MAYENYGPSERDNWHEDHRAKFRKPMSTRTTWKYCRKHDRVEKSTARCFKVELSPSRTAYIQTFKPFLCENLGPEPVLISSKREYREACERIGGVCPV